MNDDNNLFSGRNCNFNCIWPEIKLNAIGLGRLYFNLNIISIYIYINKCNRRKSLQGKDLGARPRPKVLYSKGLRQRPKVLQGKELY